MKVFTAVMAAAAVAEASLVLKSQKEVPTNKARERSLMQMRANSVHRLNDQARREIAAAAEKAGTTYEMLEPDEMDDDDDEDEFGEPAVEGYGVHQFLAEEKEREYTRGDDEDEDDVEDEAEQAKHDADDENTDFGRED